jgi:hypothetical protein
MVGRTIEWEARIAQKVLFTFLSKVGGYVFSLGFPLVFDHRPATARTQFDQSNT